MSHESEQHKKYTFLKGWTSYREMVIPPEFKDEQVHNIHMSFYAGAMYLKGIFDHLADMDEEACNAALDELQEEFVRFRDEVRNIG